MSMRTLLVYVLGASLALSGLQSFTATAQAATMYNTEAAQRLKGYLLMSVQSNGLWYVDPASGKRIHFDNEVVAWKFVTSQALGISNNDLQKLVISSATPAAKPNETSERLKGRFLIAVESHGEIWYVNPLNSKRYFLNGPQQGFEVLKSLALGVEQMDLETIPSNEPEPNSVVAIEPKPVVVPAPKPAPVKEVAYTNAEMGWRFASSLWKGYEAYSKDNKNDWPDIKWFNNITSYGQPIYLNENGFQLDNGKTNYFVWNDFSGEWKTFYSKHFSMMRANDVAIMSVYLPKAVQTEYGLLQPGTYYFTSDRGFLTETQFKTAPTMPTTAPSTDAISMAAKQKDAARVVEQVRAVQKALEKYRTDVHGYPVTYEHALELGVNGITNLSYFNGFNSSPKDNDVVYIKNISSGYPSTKIMYDSRYDGSTYVIQFTLYGSYDGYEPGKYEFGPYTAVKVADL